MNNAATIVHRLNALAACTDIPGEITRLYLTPAHRNAAMLVKTWMEQAGLDTSIDPSGTVVGARPGPTATAPRLLLGSHIDTVRHAGRYDGCLGVAVAIAAVANLAHTALPYAIDIRAFGDEEGVRFPVTLTGAHATAGKFNPKTLELTDKTGISLKQALADFGLDPNLLAAGACTATHAVAYLELHIEQGPVLEAANMPLGVVTAISGAARFTVVVTGRAGHAGTVPMAERQDALAAACTMVLNIRSIARARQHVVATVGTLTVLPNATNVIPGQCSFTIDLRSPDDEKRDTCEQAIRQALRATADAENVVVAMEKTHEAQATRCDPRLQAHLAQSLSARSVNFQYLPSGAGHDAMAIAALCPIGMLFVRCAGGISHHPDESVLDSDIEIAVDVLTHALTHFSPAQLEPHT